MSQSRPNNYQQYEGVLLYKKTILKFTGLLSEFLTNYRNPRYALTLDRAKQIISDIDDLDLDDHIINFLTNQYTSNLLSKIK